MRHSIVKKFWFVSSLLIYLTPELFVFNFFRGGKNGVLRRKKERIENWKEMKFHMRA